jgi:hypothetical protein
MATCLARGEAGSSCEVILARWPKVVRRIRSGGCGWQPSGLDLDGAVAAGDAGEFLIDQPVRSSIQRLTATAAGVCRRHQVTPPAFLCPRLNVDASGSVS